MNPISFVYTEVLFRPIFNLLVAITNFLPTHSMGLAIILVTLIVRLILLPSSIHQAKQMSRNQDKMAKIKEGTDAIKLKYKDDKAKQAEETMKLYKETGVNPASGCLPLLIQLPILIALYRVFFAGIGPDSFHYLYSFVSTPEIIQAMFLGIDLHSPSLLLGVLAGAGQFFQMKFMSSAPANKSKTSDDDPAAMMASMQKNMAYIFPAMTVFIALSLPAALSLYWVVSTFFGLGQQYIFKKTLNISSAPATM